VIRIEIKSAKVNVKSGTAKASGKPYTIKTQEGYAHTVDREGKPRPYPQQIEIALEKEQEPFAPGVYTIGPATLYVGDYNRLMLGRLVLIGVAPVAASKAA